MKRLSIEARPNWQSKVEEDGILWAVTEDGPYWNEAMKQPVYYSFSKQEQESLERAGNELHKMCLESITWLLDEAPVDERNQWLDKFGIPEHYRELLINTWDEDEWGLYGRFDFIMTKNGPKLLEYNADTPTTLIESAITQWNWFDDNRSKLPANVNQFNEIHEALVRHWSDMKTHNSVVLGVHFVAYSQVDDMATVAYMAECAKEAGHDVTVMPIEGIGDVDKEFVDLNDELIFNCFKLYPWEWMWEDDFGDKVVDMDNYCTRWIEPLWKALLSNKAILALLWKRYPECEFLVPAYLDEKQFIPRPGQKWVTKPLLSREGSNVCIWSFDDLGMAKVEQHTDGEYDEEHIIYQQYIEWEPIDGCYPMIGVWMVGEDAVGVGIREDDGPVTQNNSRFIPHVFETE